MTFYVQATFFGLRQMVYAHRRIADKSVDADSTMLFLSSGLQRIEWFGLKAPGYFTKGSWEARLPSYGQIEM